MEKCLWAAVGLMLAAMAVVLLPEQAAGVSVGSAAGRGTAPATTSVAATTAAAASGTEISPDRGKTSYELRISNKTDYLVEPETVAVQAFSPWEGKTSVLIVHTHASEAYTPDGEFPYTPTDTDRTDDCSRNMVAVGRALKALLTGQGITVYHDETLHDDPSYSGAYGRSLRTVEEYLAQHADIGLVIDLHRDAFLYEDGTRLRCVCEVDGEKAAQIMLVVGTDAGGLQHPDWRENLAAAAGLQLTLEALCPGITRPIDLRRERFNQHVSGGAMIVEMGASGNTLGEALRSVSVLAEAIGELMG